MANSGNFSFPRCLSRALFPRTARELLAVIAVGILLMNSGLVAAPAVPSAKSQTEVVAQLGEHRFVHHGRFRSLYFLPSGEELLAVTEDEACVWDVRTGKQRVRFEYQPGEATSTMCGAMSRDGQTLLLAENGPLLYIFDTATGRRKAVLEGAKDRAPVVA